MTRGRMALNLMRNLPACLVGSVLDLLIVPILSLLLTVAERILAPYKRTTFDYTPRWLTSMRIKPYWIAPVERDRRSAEALAKAKQWRLDHTDPVLGTPALNPIPTAALHGTFREPHPSESSKFKPDGITGYRGNLIVMVDRHPVPEEQREIYRWIVTNIDSIGAEVPRLLREANKDPRFYHVDDAQAEIAYDRGLCEEIHLSGVSPVKWRIHFYAAIEQDVVGDIEGEDREVKAACLYL